MMRKVIKMGMFDTFIASENLKCPKCKKVLAHRDLQSKALLCALDTYKQGDPITIKHTKGRFSIKEGWIEAHTICNRCDSYVQYKLIIEDGRWTKIVPWKGHSLPKKTAKFKYNEKMVKR